MTQEFLSAIDANKQEFGVEISPRTSEGLSAYYSFLIPRNELLHLVGPCSPEEFAIRHVLESLYVASRLPKAATIVDVGSGGGLPGIPLAIHREDLNVILIESKEKKAEFLKEAVDNLAIGERVKVVNKQFAEALVPKHSIVTARALDKFPKILPKLVKWAGGKKMILFGGPALEEALAANGIAFEKTLIPMSEQRFVFEIGTP